MTSATLRTPCDEGVIRAAPEATPCARATGRWVLAAAILGSALTFIDGTVINVALPLLQQQLGASVAEAQWIVESYALMLAALILVGGSLGDRLGRRRVFAVGVALFALASIACGLSANVTQLIVARGVKGIGAALLVPGSLALISASFSKQTRGRAIGTWSGFSAIAAGLGPVLGGWLIEHVSWRWIFPINVPLAAIVLWIVWRYVPESRDETSTGALDWPGAALATIGLGGIVFALIESNTAGWAARSVVAGSAVGILALVAFVIAEARHKAPMMPLDLFRSRTFAGANLLTLFLYAALGALLFFLPFNLVRVQGYSATAAGATLLPFVLMMFLLSRWAGGLVDRYGSKLPLVIGPLVAASGFALFSLPGVDAGSYWTSFFPATMVMSLGMTISVAPLTTTVMGAVDERHAGVASGINNAVSRTAALLAIAVFGVVIVQAFEASLAERAVRLPLEPAVRDELLEGAKDLVNMPIPVGMNEEARAATQLAIRESFVAGFRRVSWLAGLLGVASAIAAWVLIEGKPRARGAAAIFIMLSSTTAWAASPDEDRALSIAREFERQARQGTLWPGFEPLAIPLAIYTGERTYLFRHPSPPAGFSSLGGTQPAAFAFEGRHPAVTSNSSSEIGGILTATLLADGERAKRSPSTLAATAIHESFHVFQRQHHPGWSGNEGSIFLYPSDDARLLGLRRLETASLRHALVASDASASACWTRVALGYRRERFAAMDSSFATYERQTELNEGLATYVELLALGQSTVELPANEFAATVFRDRLYATGPALAFLLDRLRPGWQRELESDDKQFLDRMLEPVSEGRDGACSIPPDEIDAIRSQASADAAAVVATRVTRRKSFDARSGWRVVIETDGNEPLWPQGFDPLNVERVDGGLLHTRYLKLGNGTCELSMLDEQSVDLEAFTEAAGEHPLFNGVRRATIAGLAKPGLETTPGQVTIRALGFGATFRGATAQTSGDRIIVRWSPAKQGIEPAPR